jgi:arylsulfatase A-like enzyme
MTGSSKKMGIVRRASSVIGLSLLGMLIGCGGGDTSSGDTSGTEESGVVTETGETGETNTTDVPVLHLSGDAPSNLLIVSVDTLRADFTYGGISDHNTPFLQQLMTDSLVLEEHVSCANWTVASLYCMLTGRTTEQIGVHPLSNKMLRMPGREVTMAELFQQAGHTTSLISANPLFTESLGLTQGFDVVQVGAAVPADTLTTMGIELIEQQMATTDGNGWFTQIHYYDPHGGYNPPAEYLGDTSDLASIPYDITTNDGLRMLRADEAGFSREDILLIREHLTRYYGGEVRFLDHELSRLFEVLDSMGALDDTLVLFVSDHGEQLLEHGAAEHLRNLFREEIHVPAFFWMKDQRLARGAWPEVTSHQDLLPSVLNLFDIVSDDIEFDGAVVGEASSDRVTVSIHGVAQGSAVLGRLGQHELIYRWDGGLELYDLNSDPEELVNLYQPQDLSIVDQIWPHVESTANAISEIAKLDPPVVPPVYQ